MPQPRRCGLHPKCTFAQPRPSSACRAASTLLSAWPTIRQQTRSGRRGRPRWEPQSRRAHSRALGATEVGITAPARYSRAYGGNRGGNQEPARPLSSLGRPRRQGPSLRTSASQGCRSTPSMPNRAKRFGPRSPTCASRSRSVCWASCPDPGHLCGSARAGPLDAARRRGAEWLDALRAERCFGPCFRRSAP